MEMVLGINVSIPCSIIPPVSGKRNGPQSNIFLSYFSLNSGQSWFRDEEELKYQVT